MDTTMGIYNHTTFLGFASFWDIPKQLFKYHQLKMSLIINFAIAMTLLFLTLPFLDEYVWNPFSSLIFLGVVVTLDFISAVMSNWKKEKFKTEKATKYVFTLVAYLILFGVLNGFSKVVVALGVDFIFRPVAFDYMAKFVYFLCLSVNFISAIKHLSNLGLIPKQVARFIEKFIDTHKNRIEETISSTGEEKGSQREIE